MSYNPPQQQHQQHHQCSLDFPHNARTFSVLRMRGDDRVIMCVWMTRPYRKGQCLWMSAGGSESDIQQLCYTGSQQP